MERNHQLSFAFLSLASFAPAFCLIVTNLRSPQLSVAQNSLPLALKTKKRRGLGPTAWVYKLSLLICETVRLEITAV